MGFDELGFGEAHARYRVQSGTTGHNVTVSGLADLIGDVMYVSCNAVFRPSDCADILNYGTIYNGVYVIYIGNEQRPLSVYCDMTTDGDGWTVRL